MSHTESRESKNDRAAQPRRRFLGRLTALAGVFIALGTMGEASADWSPLGGGLTSRPLVGRNEDGRLGVFARGEDGALWHIWQRLSGGWWGWSSLGGYLTSNIAVNNNLDGRLEVFVRGGDDSLYHKWQTTPNGVWGDYSRLDGILVGDPTVVRNKDGRMEIFVRGNDNTIWHRWQVAPNIGWSQWEALPDTAGTVTGNIAAIATKGGGLNLFWRGADGRLRWKQQSVANGAWGTPRSLGGPIIDSDIAVAEYGDRRLVMLVRGTDNYLYYWRPGILALREPLNVWRRFGEGFTGNIAVAKNSDGRLVVFARKTNLVLYHAWQERLDPSLHLGWINWKSLGGDIVSDPAVGVNRDGRLEVFALGTDRALYHRWQLTAGGTDWS